MTAPRRTLLFLLTGLATGPIPACLVRGPVPSDGPPAGPVGGKFADLQPGARIATNTAAKPGPAADANPPALPITPGRTDALPGPPAAPVTSRRPDPDDVEAPQPRGAVAAAKVEPGPLPIPTGPPVPEPPLVAAVRAHAAGRPDEALKHLQGLDKPNQEFALAVLPILARGAQMNLASADPNDLAVLVDQLHSVAAGLEPKAALRVEKVAFCRCVSGFGRYDPWPEAEPYRPNNQALLYVEVRHLTSEPAPGPGGEAYVTRAVVSLEVRDADGKLVEQADPAEWRRRVPVARFEHADHSRAPLRDYSRAYRILVPPTPGVYTVTVEVKDPAGARTARSRPVEFRVAGP